MDKYWGCKFNTKRKRKKKIFWFTGGLAVYYNTLSPELF